MKSFLYAREKVIPAVLRDPLRVVIVLVLASIAYFVLGQFIGWLARIAERRTSDPARRQHLANAYTLVSSVIKGTIIFAAGMIALEQVGVRPVASGSVLGKVIATIVIAWIAFEFTRRGIHAALNAAAASIPEGDRRQRISTLLLLAVNAARFTIIFFAGLMVLRDLGLNLTPVLAGAGIAGLAVGFGAQNLVRDVVAGFFIILENQYAVGDLVEINGTFGRVEVVGLRVTMLRDPNGELRYFPNGSISTATNYTENHIPYAVTVPLPADGPPDPLAFVARVLEDFERELRVFTRPPAVGPIDDLPTYARIARATVCAIPGRHSLVEQKLPARITAAFRRAGHPLPDDTEVTVVLRFPPPASGAPTNQPPAVLDAQRQLSQ